MKTMIRKMRKDRWIVEFPTPIKVPLRNEVLEHVVVYTWGEAIALSGFYWRRNAKR